MDDAPLLIALQVLLCALLGLAYGSFGNVLISRLPAGEHVTGRSRCPACRRTLHPAELLPLLSFLVLRGRCRTCRSAIAWQYPLVEAVSAMLLLAALPLASSLPASIALGLALSTLLFIAVVDAQTQTIPDVLSLLLLAWAALFAALEGTLALGGPLLGLGFFGAQWAVSRGRWVGSGDIVLAACIGVLLGSLPLMVVCLFASYVLGAACTSVLLVTGRRTRSDVIAFGPFLVAGAYVAVFFGPMILAYVNAHRGL